MRHTPVFLVGIVCLSLACPGRLSAQIVINEIVADPQLDWNDSGGGNGTAFDDVPGTAPAMDSDEWVELLNIGGTAVDLTSWTLVMIDTTPATETLGGGGAVLRFSDGSALDGLLPGGRLVVGNPAGQINNNCYLALLNAQGVAVDRVEIGTLDFAGDGNENNAPGGDAHGIWDEAVARSPDGHNTGNPPVDFRQVRSTIGEANPGNVPLAVFLINEVVTDPQQDWNDSTDGNNVAFDGSPGQGAVTDTDEWIELVNVSPFSGSLVDWTLVMHDTTPATETLGRGNATFFFESDGALDRVTSGGHVVVGNPAGALNNNVWLRLYDPQGVLVDEIELGGQDFRGNGLGDEAPGGNATDFGDEAVARLPDAADTGNDAADFRQVSATIGAANNRQPPTRACRWRLYR